MKIERSLRKGLGGAKDMAIDKAGRNSGAMSRLNSMRTEQIDSMAGEVDDYDNLGGRGKARRDAKAAKKTRKAGAATRKERKETKTNAKASKKTNAGKAKVLRAEKSDGTPRGAKVLDTINNVVSTAGKVLGKGESETPAETNESGSGSEAKAKFNFMAWYMILIYIVIVGLIAYFAFFKKK